MDDVQETRSKRPYLVLAGLMALIILFLWAVWVSAYVLEPKPPRLVKVQLADSISRFVEAGLSDQEVAAISGHKSMQMLKRYTHLRAEDLVEKLDKLRR